jgi:hypothetical protein
VLLKVRDLLSKDPKNKLEVKEHKVGEGNRGLRMVGLGVDLDGGGFAMMKDGSPLAQPTMAGYSGAGCPPGRWNSSIHGFPAQLASLRPCIRIYPATQAHRSMK